MLVHHPPHMNIIALKAKYEIPYNSSLQYKKVQQNGSFHLISNLKAHWFQYKSLTNTFQPEILS